jgi:hypothetical protein
MRSRRNEENARYLISSGPAVASVLLATCTESHRGLSIIEPARPSFPATGVVLTGIRKIDPACFSAIFQAAQEENSAEACSLR